ncbi:TPA: hypothetical protein EYP66_00790 [Candidatus Poribacteria bacterium]|nr:hypothetical protein [Candidatus Poribacteria bacterium]
MARFIQVINNKENITFTGRAMMVRCAVCQTIST